MQQPGQVTSSTAAVWLKRLNEHKWSIGAAAFLIVGMLSARGGMQVLVGMVRIVAPFVLILIVLRLLTKKIFGAAGAAMRKQMEAMMQSGMQGGSAPGGFPGGRAPQDPGTITLCSKCGSYLKPGHVCSKS